MRSSLVLATGLLAASASLAGCLGSGTQELVGCEEVVDVSTFYPETSDGALARADGEPAPIVVFLENVAGVPLTAQLWTEPEAASRIWEGDPGGSSLGERRLGHLLDEDERVMDAFRLERTSGNGSVTLHVTTDAEHPEAAVKELACEFDREIERTFVLAEPGEAERGQAGKGVLVRTVGWWTNGSSFYTNLGRYHERGDLPKGYLGPYNGSEPLKVYVYNESGEEMPERYNDSGYVTTIPGFNEALKGIPVTGARLVHLQPEEAYTREGYEEHPLYGDALVFYIEAVEVRGVPCQVPPPVCEVPDPPRDPGTVDELLVPVPLSP